MTDLVERLRASKPETDDPAQWVDDVLAYEAADEIEQLRMQLADHGETITRLEAEIAWRRAAAVEVEKEIERLKHERHSTKRMLEDILSRTKPVE